jgi:MoaA/NifB/PqqE/SkfB family radical SAM enzyme
MGRDYTLPGSPRGPVRRLLDALLRKPLRETPETVLIETQAGCNARCVFCPIGDDTIRRAMPMGRMSTALFEQIVGQLEESPPRNVIPCFANEPFLDKRLIDWLVVLRRRLPSTRVTVVTNGSLLTGEVARRLLAEEVPDLLNISFHGLDKATYEASMGPLDFDETLSRVLALVDLKRAMGRRRPRLKVSMVATRLVEHGIEEARRFWTARGVEFEVDRLENRGGSVPLSGLAGGAVPYTSCRRPFNTLVIAFDGKVPLCCVDFERKVIVGDAAVQSLREIWSSERLMSIRRGFLDPERRSDLPTTCRECKLAE